jgi:nicotinate dehydrogenase subunit B
MDRRTFLSNSGALVVGFSLLSKASDALASGKTVDKSVLDAWLGLEKDGRVTVYTGKVDLGTGTRTALTQIAADELDVAFDQVSLVMGDTASTPDQGLTGGALTISVGGMELRKACATARKVLIERAAKQWGVSPQECLTQVGNVILKDKPQQLLSYKQLLPESGFETKVDDKIALRPVSEYKWIGRSVQRVDIPAKVQGKFQFVHDVTVPGILHARVVRSTMPDAKLLSVDDSKARRIEGFVATVKQGNFLAVVAKTEWAAVKAASLINPQWQAAKVLPLPNDVVKAWRAKPVSRSVDTQKIGDADAQLAQAPSDTTRLLKSTYSFGIQTHASIGPSCAVAQYKDGTLTVWSASQATHSLVKELATATGISPASIVVNYVDGSGCYGRNGHEDCSADAAIVAKALGQPIRLQWMRQDETANSPKSPPTVADFQAMLDEKSQLKAMRGDYYVGEHVGPLHEFPLLASSEQGIELKGNFVGLHFQNAALPYKLPQILIKTHQIRENIFRSSHLRTPGRLENSFCNESFLDEVIHAAGKDAIEWRLERLEDSRAIAVIEAVAKLANWDKKLAGSKPQISGDWAKGQGFAYARYNNAHTYVSGIAKVAVHQKTGEVKVEDFFIGHDCGQIINPDGCKNQIEGCVIQTVSRVLMERVAHDTQRVTSVDWATYPISRFGEIPKVSIALIDRPSEVAWGVGEPAAVPVPAAIANAIFDAVGVRVRSVPLSRKELAAAIEGKGKKA